MEEELRQEIAELRIELKQKDSTIETLATKLRAYEAMEKTKGYLISFFIIFIGSIFTLTS